MRVKRGGEGGETSLAATAKLSVGRRLNHDGLRHENPCIYLALIHAVHHFIINATLCLGGCGVGAWGGCRTDIAGVTDGRDLKAKSKTSLTLERRRIVQMVYSTFGGGTHVESFLGRRGGGGLLEVPWLLCT